MGKQEPITAEFLPGTLALLIPHALKRGPQHGYGIAKKVKEASAEALAVEEGSLYPALNRLLVKGWVRAEWGVSDNNRRTRFYELTKEGLERAEAVRREFGSAARIREETRDAWRVKWVEDLLPDLRYTARAMTRTPAILRVDGASHAKQR